MTIPVDPKVLLGALLVALVAASRFNTAPPARETLPDGTSRPLGLLRTIFQLREEPASALFPPPRAHTTFFKFQLYRAAYALTGVAVYLALYAIPGVAGEVDRFMATIGTETIPTLANGGPILIAFVVALLFPVCPPFRAGERAVRRTFYDRASIPAQQLRERHRLKHAPYVVDPLILKTVQDHLAQEDFEPADLLMEETPTTRSMWTKAAVLMAHIERWQGEDRYKTAFATLREQAGITRSVDRLSEVYEALKPDARMWFKAVRAQAAAPETSKREASFRRNCLELLVSIYDFLSRVSLHAHYTDRDRVTRMRELGFVLRPSHNGPIPDANDIAALGVLIAGIVILPLSYQVGTPHAILISVEVYAAIITPILLAARFPLLAAARSHGTPQLAFPLAAGLVAAAVGVVAHTLVFSYQPAGASWFDLARGWSRYATRSYPWSFLLFLLAALIAWRMRTQAYPDPRATRGLARITLWGNVTDAGLFLGCTLALVGFYIRPKVAELLQTPARADDWMLLLLPSAIAAVLGFFVPTWYRANAVTTDAAVSSPRRPAAVVPAS